MTPCSGLGEEEWKTRIIEDLERRGERREGGEKEEEKEEVLARVALSFDLMDLILILNCGLYHCGIYKVIVVFV